MHLGYIVIRVVKVREILGKIGVQLQVELQDDNRQAFQKVPLQEVIAGGTLTLDCPKPPSLTKSALTQYEEKS